MLARLDGQVTLVSGAIPGERVRARIEGRHGGVLFATTVDVLDVSPDRHVPGDDPACGGRCFAHITAPRQRALKAEIVVDAFRRLGRIELPAALAVHPSPDDGYRMRARLHVSAAAIGFYREGTHTLCDPACTRQLLPETVGVLAALSERLERIGLTDGRSLELAENRDATERALYLEVGSARQASRLGGLLDLPGVTGLGVAHNGRPIAATGSSRVADQLDLADGDTRAPLRLARHVTGFFQGNRHLLQTLVERVLALIPPGPMTDLYAGVGLFGLAHAALGRGDVIAVEGDRLSIEDLLDNAEPFEGRVRVEPRAVEDALGDGAIVGGRTTVVDPPRTGLSRHAIAALTAGRPPRVVYVSCDVATLARDARLLVEAGFAVATVELFDLFPSTAHIETVVSFERQD